MKVLKIISSSVIIIVCMALLSCNDDPNLPMILIKTNSTIKWNDRTNCLVCYINDCDTTCWKGNVKFRGGMSSKYPKHSYSLKLVDDESICDLPKSKSWILNASYIDKTFMRHKICYDIFRNMGDYNVAPQCAYSLVSENGNPQGLYVVMQRLNKHLLKVDETDDKALIFKEPKVFFADSVMPEKSFPNENFNEQTYPDFEKFGDKSAILDEFHNFILHSSDEEFKTNIDDWIDMRNVADWHLLILFTNNSDGVRKNFYLYKINTETPFRIAIWDCDHSLGRDGDNERNMLERLTEDNRNILFNRLLGYDWYQVMLRKRWMELRDSEIISYKKIAKMIRKNDRIVKQGLPENLALWSFDSRFYYDDNDYEQEKSLMLEFVSLSLAKMDERFCYGKH